MSLVDKEPSSDNITYGTLVFIFLLGTDIKGKSKGDDAKIKYEAKTNAGCTYLIVC